MPIQFTKFSFICSILSAFALILSWIGRPLLGTHEMVMGVFFLSFLLSATAVVTGILAIAKARKSGKRTMAWLAGIVGFVLFIPISAVVVIFVVVLVAN